MNVSTSGQPSPRFRAKYAVFALVLLSAGAAAGWVVMTLWNAVLANALGTKPLSYWNALGLLLLCRILFGNWGPRHRGPSSGPVAMREKWAAMTPEQRAQFKEHWRARCAHRDETNHPEESR